MKHHDKEKVMQKLWNEVVIFAGSDIQTKDTKKIAESISTALDAAYKAGEESKVEKVRNVMKEVAEDPYYESEKIIELILEALK